MYLRRKLCVNPSMYIIDKYHKWVYTTKVGSAFASADWVRKWILSTIHLRAADETKLLIKSFVSDQFFSGILTKIKLLFGICVVFLRQ